jgi:hypothetical protein
LVLLDRKEWQNLSHVYIFKATFTMDAMGRQKAAVSKPTAVRLPGWNRICMGLIVATKTVSLAVNNRLLLNTPIAATAAATKSAFIPDRNAVYAYVEMLTQVNMFRQDLPTVLKTTAWNSRGDLLAWVAQDWAESEKNSNGKRPISLVMEAEVKNGTGLPYLVAIPMTDDMTEVNKKSTCSHVITQQSHNTENSIQIFPGNQCSSLAFKMPTKS